MLGTWEITAGWESLDAGSDEERACFAALGIRAHSIWLTEGHDAIVNRLRQAPYLSAYDLAEWLAWNWWRLRWEPRSMADGWDFSHRMASIGGGYVWPDITIFSDGERTVLLSRATAERPQTPFRYINQVAPVISALDFERGVEVFVAQVLERLEAMGVRESNLSCVWRDVQAERGDETLGRRRKLEALMGVDPDESDPELVERVLADAVRLGQGAVEELAADAGSAVERRGVLSADELAGLAVRSGFAASFDDGVRLAAPATVAPRGQLAAWQLGADAAKALRAQEALGEGAIDDAALAALLGVTPAALKRPAGVETVGISFALRQAGEADRVLLRSRVPAGRRFELARLLGDRLLGDVADSLLPATRSTTYRQKAQRAFAAELLSPFAQVLGMLDGDFSAENQQEVAEHFKVSELTIRTQLVNHRILDRDELESEEFSIAA